MVQSKAVLPLDGVLLDALVLFVSGFPSSDTEKVFVLAHPNGEHSNLGLGEPVRRCEDATSGVLAAKQLDLRLFILPRRETVVSKAYLRNRLLYLLSGTKLLKSLHVGNSDRVRLGLLGEALQVVALLLEPSEKVVFGDAFRGAELSEDVADFGHDEERLAIIVAEEGAEEGVLVAVPLLEVAIDGLVAMEFGGVAS